MERCDAQILVAYTHSYIHTNSVLILFLWLRNTSVNNKNFKKNSHETMPEAFYLVIAMLWLCAIPCSPLSSFQWGFVFVRWLRTSEISFNWMKKMSESKFDQLIYVVAWREKNTIANTAHIRCEREAKKTAKFLLIPRYLKFFKCVCVSVSHPNGYAFCIFFSARPDRIFSGFRAILKQCKKND